ncbi:hypothetical protein ACHAXA_001507 [Cyclostephanos tholiformis]|jgi:hypothetical protein|uniref:Bindin n=1 Tax=Cyclostephanos tholiformis TaxID=382380 RepID=A0ABD3RWM6_9STRA
MGRSQVERNRAARGHGGRGGIGGGRGPPRNRPPADAVLGDNAYRYERRHGPAAVNNDDDGNDDSGWTMTFGGGGDDATYRDIVFGDVLKNSKMTPSGGGGGMWSTTDEWHAASSSTNDGHDGDGAGDWMRIDVKALDECLREIPIHERLKLPRHVGDHLISMYGADVCRKKTLGELREESKCVVGTTESENEEDGKAEEEKLEEGKEEEEKEEEEEEDLEAWLDDMIA